MPKFTLPPNVTHVIGPSADNKEYELFLTPGAVVPLAAADKGSVEALGKQLGASIGRATVTGGVLHVSLSRAAESRCSLRLKYETPLLLQSRSAGLLDHSYSL